jgi:hypothetical protein
MSKRIVLVDSFGFELFSGASVANEEPREPEVDLGNAEKAGSGEGARQGGPLESGIFFRGAPRLKKTG